MSNLPSCPQLVLLLLVATLTGCDRKSTTHYPSRPIKLVIPFGAGGGSDTFGRLIQQAIESNDLLPQPMVVLNVPGAGGTIGSRRVKNARPDGYTLLLLHEGILTAKHSGQAAYGPEAFEPIAGSSNATQVIAVSESSPIKDLAALMARAAAEPESLVFAANVGAPSYFAGLMLEAEREGAAFRYTQSGGGAKRFAALQGGHVDVTSFSIAEYVQFRPSGIRALALLGEFRDPSLPDLATAREQGFDVVNQNMQFWWAPAGTPPERVAVIADAIDAAMAVQDVRSKLSQMGMEPTLLRGDELAEDLAARESAIAAVAPKQLSALPNFSLWAFAGLIASVVLAITRSVGRRSSEETASPRTSEPMGRDSRTTMLISVALLAYVVVLQSRVVGFRIATVVFTLVAGIVLARPNWKSGATRMRVVASIGCVAAFMGLAIHWLFTQVLVVDLP
ncbi:MAG: tripartite tricarboxylate transporter substrate-binding protein [Planctomycetota bacterium]